VFVMVGDGSYLMMPGELVTAVQEGVKLTIVLVDNAGYASIGALSRSLGTDGFGTLYRARRDGSLGTDSADHGERLPIDLAANAESLGARVIRASTVEELRAALAEAKRETRPTVIAVATDRYEGVPSYESWWDVPVSEVADADSVREARSAYDDARASARAHL
jgi:3D-(3,5/4)-trihydroxycyclohexane-1,2-dione acylhydrolase (decyclizing)